FGNGSRALELTANRISGGFEAVSLEASAGVVIGGNDFRDVRGAAISVEGINPVVQRNRVTLGESGIFVTCTPCFGGAVSDNVVTDLQTDAINVRTGGFGMEVSRNSVARTGGGILVNAIGAAVAFNRASDVGVGDETACFEVSGDEHTVSRNT